MEHGVKSVEEPSTAVLQVLCAHSLDTHNMVYSYSVGFLLVKDLRTQAEMQAFIYINPPILCHKFKSTHARVCCIIVCTLHTTGAQATSGLWYENNIPYQVFDMSCSGTEDELLDCQYSTTSPSCGRLSHATVFCQKGS